MKMIAKLIVCVLFVSGLLIGCATTPNEITINAQPPETVYISPMNGDGIQDTFETAVNLEMLEKAAALAGYEIVITDSNETIVYTRGEVGTPKPKGLRGLFGKPSGVENPTVIIWDGKDLDNSYVEDGTYYCSMRAWDFRGAEASFGPVQIIVDNTAPWLELSTSYRIFSPEGDGQLDTITINQRSATFEEIWSGTIRRGSNVINSYSWEGRAEDFVWDGRDSAGGIVTDGMYEYLVASKDRAGNSAEFSIEGIEVDTSPKGVRLGRSVNAFSPNGDGKQDTVNFNPSVVTSNNLVDWKIAVVNESGSTVRILPGTGTVPTSVVFDGMGDDGRLLPDGRYRGVFSVRYTNGSRPETASPQIILDTTLPVAAVNVDYPLFSPDGDGKRDSLFIRQSTSVERNWKGTIVDEGGNTVREYSWNARASATTWDGKDSTGKFVPDGRYTYSLAGTDQAGNSTETVLTGITVDTRPARVQVSAARRAFSPNNDGFFDTLSLNLTAVPADGIKNWSLAILSADGRTVQSYGKTEETLPASIVWNGFNGATVAMNGSYSAFLMVEYWKGDIAEMNSGSFALDTVGPVLTLELSPKPFSPDGDGNADTANIKPLAQDASGIQDWRIQIADPEGNMFKSYSGVGSSLNTIRWDGRSVSGELVQSASDYTVTFSALDAVGNISAVQDVLPVDILVFREGDQLRIVLSNIYFEPFTTNYLNVPRDEAAENIVTLDRLAEILKKYPTYQIHAEGHAVRIYWNDPVRGPVEERQVLIPLSLGRAEVIREALVERGVQPGRITVEGLGGTRPVVPHSDIQNRWKNRRVEFILVK